MAIDRLPGHASGELAITEQSFPVRSTIADHISFGLKSPPLFSVTTLASLACNAVTVAVGIAQASWAFDAVGSIASRLTAGMAIHFNIVKLLGFCGSDNKQTTNAERDI